MLRVLRGHWMGSWRVERLFDSLGLKIDRFQTSLFQASLNLALGS